MLKSKIDIDDFLTLIYWVRTYFIFEGKKFAYQSLLEQAETYKFTNTPFDTKLHCIDELMIDAFKIYHKLKESEKRVEEVLETIPFVNKEEMLNETKKYQSIFEDLIENYKYEDTEIRGIQKGILNEKMNEYVAEENYEKAAIVRDMIKEC